MKKKSTTARVEVNSKKRGELLFEIGCEEIPAGMIFKAAGELKALLEASLVENGLVDAAVASQSIEAFGAPRRLVGIVRGVLLRQVDVTKEVTGPPKAVAFDCERCAHTRSGEFCGEAGSLDRQASDCADVEGRLPGS